MNVSQSQFQSLNLSGRPANRSHSEASLQAYVRHLHENRSRQAGDGEPVRGRDPWLGLAL